MIRSKAFIITLTAIISIFPAGKPDSAPRSTAPSASAPTSAPTAALEPSSGILTQQSEPMPTVAPDRANDAMPVSTPIAAQKIESSNENVIVVAASAQGEFERRAPKVIDCESRGIATLNTGNGYYGAWQFSLSTWRAVGGVGLPSDATLEEQTYRAKLLYQQVGWSAWPICGYK